MRPGKPPLCFRRCASCVLPMQSGRCRCPFVDLHDTLRSWLFSNGLLLLSMFCPFAPPVLSLCTHHSIPSGRLSTPFLNFFSNFFRQNPQTVEKCGRSADEKSIEMWYNSIGKTGFSLFFDLLSTPPQWGQRLLPTPRRADNIEQRSVTGDNRGNDGCNTAQMPRCCADK